MTHKDPCTVICDVTQTKQCKNKAYKRDSSVLTEAGVYVSEVELHHFG